MCRITHDITGLLHAWSDGDESALEQLIPLVEGELRRLAGAYMRRERVGHTLQTTALVNEAFMRLVDAIQGFPAILSALLFAAVFAPGIVISMVAIGIAFVPAFARLTRAGFLELRAREFVVAARALGARDRRLIARHILPNTLAPLIVQATTSFPVAILAEAGLAYLGLGTQPPHPSWGLMLREAQSFLSMNPWYAVFPGGAIALTVLGLNLLGDGLRDLLDPKTA